MRKQNRQKETAANRLTGKDILIAMNNLEEELVELTSQDAEKLFGQQTQAAELLPVRSRRTAFTKALLKWGAVAAAAVLFLGGGVAYAAVKYGLFMEEKYSSEEKSGYRLQIVTEKIPVEQFSDEIHAVELMLKEDIASAEDAEERSRFGWLEHFDSMADATDFIGYAGLKTPATTGTLDEAGVVVVSNNQGQLLEVHSYGRYFLDNLSLLAEARMYTTNVSYETGAGLHVEERYVVFQEETYTTKNGKQAIIVIEGTNTQGNHYLRGFLVDGTVRYQLGILHYPEDQEAAMELMKEWLDQF